MSNTEGTSVRREIFYGLSIYVKSISQLRYRNDFYDF